MERPLRVLFLHSSREDANEYTVHRNLAHNADPKKVDCFFIWQSVTSDASQNVMPKLERKNRVFHIDFGRDQSVDPRPPRLARVLNIMLRTPMAFFFVLRKVQEIKPDVIYTTQQRHEVILAKLLSRIFHIPHIIHVCYFIGPWLGNLTFQTIKKNPHVFASCEFVRQSGIKAGIPAENIETMHHMADLETFSLAPDREWLRAEFGWSPDTPVITAAARLDKDKGFTRLVNAFEKVHAEMPEARLLICGVPSPGTSHDQVIKSRVKELHLEEYIKFAGYRKDLPRIFAGSDVFSQPIKFDASSLVILGAMATGLPVVACYSGSVPEVVADGETGLLSELDDRDALANNLLKLLRDPELQQKMGIAGKERARKVFGPKTIADVWVEKLYRRIGKKAEKREENESVAYG